MIYNQPYLRSILRSSYIERELGRKRLMYVSVFLAVGAIALHSLLDTVYESVITEVLPQLMLPSNYTVAYTYALIAYGYFLILFMQRYDRVTFAQIGQNKWYLLGKMGHNINSLIITKTATMTGTVFMIYSVGYVFALVLAVFFKYPFVPNYLVTLFISGLIDVMFFVWVTLFLSLFVRNRRKASALLLGVGAGQLLLRYLTGYADLVRDRSRMEDLLNLFNPAVSPYLLILLVALVALMIATGAVARHKSHYYSMEPPIEDLAVRDYRTNKLEQKREKTRKLSRAISFAVKGVLSLVVGAFIVGSAFILIISLSSASREFSIYGYIPYIVQSETMEDAIQKNDLVMFRKVDTASPIEPGEVVLFSYMDNTFIEQVVSVEGTMYTVDITNYPEYAEDRVMEKTVERIEIYGVLDHTNRWLGALLLFANTFIGRLLMFLLPVCIIFFYKQLSEFLARIFHNPNAR